MGIYDKKIAEGLNLNLGIAKKTVIAVIIVIVVVAISFALYTALKAKPISLRFSENPWNLSKQNASQSITLTAVITNTTRQTASNVVVKASAVEFDSINIFPTQTEIPILGSFNRREIPFIIRLNKPLTTIKAGSYTINVEMQINGESFEETTVLELQK